MVPLRKRPATRTSISKILELNSTKMFFHQMWKCSVFYPSQIDSMPRIAPHIASIPTSCHHSCWRVLMICTWWRRHVRNQLKKSKKKRPNNRLSSRLPLESRKSFASQGFRMNMSKKKRVKAILGLSDISLTRLSRRCMAQDSQLTKKAQFTSCGPISKAPRSTIILRRRSNLQKQLLNDTWWTWQPMNTCTSIKTL